MPQTTTAADAAENPDTRPAPPLTFRPAPHSSGTLTIHTATTDTHTIELYRVNEAEGARTHGAWFMRIRVAGGVLAAHSRHATMAAGRQFAAAVLATVDGPAHVDLLAAHALVADGVAERAELAGMPDAEPIVVLACGAAKLDHRAPAADLYTSPHFALMLRAARRVAGEQAGRVLILSALHGLVECERELEPYDVKMGDPRSVAPATIAEQLACIAPRSITTLLPRAYAAVLDEAAGIAGAPAPIDLLANAPGIGYQRRVAARLLATG